MTLLGSKVRWRFQVAQTRDILDEQIDALRRTLVRSFLLLAADLIVLASLQTWYCLMPLRLVIQDMRIGASSRIEGAMPAEIAPLVEELNALVAHNDKQTEEARQTLLTVIMSHHRAVRRSPHHRRA